MSEPEGTRNPTADSLDPARYPWEPAVPPGVVARGEFHPSRDVDAVLADHGAAPMRARHPVVAVGSNASPMVMHRKLELAGVSTVVPMTSTRLRGVDVGHSAHVSLPGFIAAAPYRAIGASRSFVTTHLDVAQLAALDGTEPNYRRVRVDGVWLYASMWGVIAIDDEVVTLRSQAALHTALADVDPRFRTAVGDRGPDAAVADLAHDGTVNSWRHRWRSMGLSQPDGLR